jgi:hypothetical protein
MLAGLSDWKEDEDGKEETDGAGAQNKLKHIKRMKSRISSWFIPSKRDY